MSVLAKSRFNVIYKMKMEQLEKDGIDLPFGSINNVSDDDDRVVILIKLVEQLEKYYRVFSDAMDISYSNFHKYMNRMDLHKYSSTREFFVRMYIKLMVGSRDHFPHKELHPLCKVRLETPTHLMINIATIIGVIDDLSKDNSRVFSIHGYVNTNRLRKRHRIWDFIIKDSYTLYNCDISVYDLASYCLEVRHAFYSDTMGEFAYTNRIQNRIMEDHGIYISVSDIMLSSKGHKFDRARLIEELNYIVFKNFE